MEYLYYTLGIIGLVAVIFFLIGFIKPSTSYSCEILVNKTIEECGYVAQDEERMSEWLDGFVKIEQVRGTHKTDGNVSNVYFRINGKEIGVKRTITAIRLFESMESLTETGCMTMEYRINMTSIGEKTKISSSTTVKGNGIFARSLVV